MQGWGRRASRASLWAVAHLLAGGMIATACAGPLTSATPRTSVASSPIPSNTPAPSAYPTPSPPLPTPAIAPEPPPDGVWTSAPIAPKGHVGDIIQTSDGGYLAVGSIDWNGAIWRSPDAVTWIEVTDVPPVGPQEAKSLGGVVQTATGFVAWGGQGIRSSEGNLSIVWTSVEGTHWEESAVLRGFLLDVTIGGPGFIGVGSKQGLDNLNGALAWSSVDGITWTDSPHVPGAGATAMLEIVPFDGGYVAVGASRLSSGSIDGKVWRSADGITWTDVTDEASLQRIGLTTVAVTGGRLVAGGSIEAGSPGGSERPAILVSDDGSSWVQAHADDCCGQIRGIVETGDGLIADYHRYVPGGGAYGIGLLRSVDGDAWDVVGVPQLEDGTEWRRALLLGQRFGLLGIGVHDIGNDEYQPVLLFPPDDLI